MADDTLCFGLQTMQNDEPSGEEILLIAPLNGGVVLSETNVFVIR